MTGFEIAAPARVEYAVADGSSIPHVGWTHFVTLVYEGGLPHLASHRWTAGVSGLDGAADHVVTSTRTDHGESVLLELDDAWAYVSLGNGNIAVIVAAASREARDTAVAYLRDRLPAAQAEDRRVPVEFWASGSYGGGSYSRTLDVPAWQDIAANYPATTRAALEQLAARPPLDRGRLLLWYGPPGTGKTHVVRALGWEWREWCDVHYVTDPEAFFGSAQYMLEVLLDEDDDDEERWRLLVLEDTGELLSADAKERTGQGLSRFLNVVDGIVGQGLRVLVLVTTNESLRTLHPAVARPGRCAAALEFGPLPPEEAAQWLTAHGLPAVHAEATLAELYGAAAGGELPRPRHPIGF
jgi:hypothetical protein